MRLTTSQMAVIQQCLKQYFGTTTDIWLFGSRVDDNKRGGDIDLYLETDIQQAQSLFEAKLRALAAIKRQLGNQKIDLVMHCRGHPLEPIHTEARNTGIQL